MKRRCTAMATCLTLLLFCFSAFAQEEGDTAEGTQDEATQGDGTPAEGEATEPPPPSDDAIKPQASDIAPAPVATTTKPIESKQTWKDIVVMPRKPIMKSGRLELMPLFGLSMNDNLVEHIALGGEINYHLTDVLSIGVLGHYYFKHVLDSEFYTRYHFNRVPSLNHYVYTAVLHFSYIPIYGKFVFFDKIFTYDVFVTGGVGNSSSKIIPRDHQWEAFTNQLVLTFPVGVGVRFLVNRWMAIYFSFKDYMMIDKYEPKERGIASSGKEVDTAKENAESRFINNIMFNMGFSFFFPTDFKYTTFR